LYSVDNLSIRILKPFDQSTRSGKNLVLERVEIAQKVCFEESIGQCS
jgi:hypothetical protein